MWDFTKVEEKKDFDVLPAGKYPVVVDGLEWKVSKAGPEYLNMRVSVISEKYANRKIFHTFNVFNKNPTTVNIALQDLKQIFVANGVDIAKLENCSKELLVEILSTCKMIANVKIKMDSVYGDKNEIKGWERFVEGNESTAEKAPF